MCVHAHARARIYVCMCVYIVTIAIMYVYMYRLGAIHGRLKEPVHLDAVDRWRATLTEDELQRVFALAPLLRKLGYPQ